MEGVDASCFMASRNCDASRSPLPICLVWSTSSCTPSATWRLASARVLAPCCSMARRPCRLPGLSSPEARIARLAVSRALLSPVRVDPRVRAPCVNCSCRARSAILVKVPSWRAVSSRCSSMRALAQTGSVMQTGLLSSARSTGPVQEKLSETLSRFARIASPSSLHAGHHFGRVVDLVERLVPAEQALHVSEGVDQAADAVDGRTDLASYVAEAVGQGVGTVGQLVEITEWPVIRLAPSSSLLPTSPA